MTVPKKIMPPEVYATRPYLQDYHLLTGSYFKIRILVQGRGGAEFKTAGIHQYFEDFKRGTNKDIGPTDNFETASNKIFRGESNLRPQVTGLSQRIREKGEGNKQDGEITPVGFIGM